MVADHCECTKAIELYNLNKWIVQYMNYNSIKLLYFLKGCLGDFEVQIGLKITVIHPGYSKCGP